MSKPISTLLKVCLRTVTINKALLPSIGGTPPKRLGYNCPACGYGVIFKRSGRSFDYYQDSEETMCECQEIDRYHAVRTAMRLDVFYQLREDSKNVWYQRIN